MRFLISILLLPLLFITGCGFQLRGTGEPLSEIFSGTHYHSLSTTTSGFDDRMKHLIILNGGILVDRDNAKTIINVSAIDEHSRQIAIAGNGALKEYERTYAITVSVVDAKTQAQLGRRDISVIKSIQLDDRRALGNDEQSSVIANSAEISLSQAVISYLNAF